MELSLMITKAQQRSLINTKTVPNGTVLIFLTLGYPRQEST
ncbi:hypothetical protein HMPREF0322_01611 [Desulfitobacterium hafniense DP7]|uniref:Uncharacterized protein n=1 Tax=Desulfitobacterium hafniense DP7 TaxID=537010 RepID=G9XL00_DESHA|nr:hypothetical protein HMPREF0322_01611 [Desulfitobacterium hafniense DP7]